MRDFCLIPQGFSGNQISEKVVDILQDPSDNPPVLMNSHRSFSFLLLVISVAIPTDFFTATSLGNERAFCELNVDLVNAVVVSCPELGVP